MFGYLIRSSAHQTTSSLCMLSIEGVVGTMAAGETVGDKRAATELSQ